MPKAAVAVAVVAAAADLSATMRATSTSAYEEFRRFYGIERHDEDDASLVARAALFDRRREEVFRHNSQPGQTWFKVINKFSDHTPGEFAALLGHRPLRRAGETSATASLLELQPSAPLAAAVDWSLKLNNTKAAKNQGGCGSCWAVASAGALETHAEAKLGSAPEVSYEQMVDCTPNPQECGGSGGCHGATSELALQYVKDHGIAAKADYKGYQSGGDGTCRPPSQSVLTTTGFVRLPENKMQPLMEAVATQGPVVVSADASDWGSYGGGVFTGCGKDAVINHAILLMGYGTDAKLKKDFWSIRNSWGPDWGESGIIRLLRHTEEGAYCGTDRKPLEGVGCKGGPAEMPVCGMCGILADSAYPTGLQLVSHDAALRGSQR